MFLNTRHLPQILMTSIGMILNVSIEVKVVTQLFKDEDYSTLQSEYNDHKFTKNLAGYRSLHLFYGTARDVIVVYKKSKKGHIAFHRIGNHKKVYDPNYQKMDRDRRMKKRRQKMTFVFDLCS